MNEGNLPQTINELFNQAMRERANQVVMRYKRDRRWHDITGAQLDERSTSQISPMPANLSEQIPEADFYNLLAYLLTLQSSKNDQTAKTPGTPRKEGEK